MGGNGHNDGNELSFDSKKEIIHDRWNLITNSNKNNLILKNRSSRSRSKSNSRTKTRTNKKKRKRSIQKDIFIDDNDKEKIVFNKKQDKIDKKKYLNRSDHSKTKYNSNQNKKERDDYHRGRSLSETYKRSSKNRDNTYDYKKYNEKNKIDINNNEKYIESHKRKDKNENLLFKEEDHKKYHDTKEIKSNKNLKKDNLNTFFNMKEKKIDNDKDNDTFHFNIDNQGKKEFVLIEKTISSDKINKKVDIISKDENNYKHIFDPVSVIRKDKVEENNQINSNKTINVDAMKNSILQALAEARSAMAGLKKSSTVLENLFFKDNKFHNISLDNSQKIKKKEDDPINKVEKIKEITTLVYDTKEEKNDVSSTKEEFDMFSFEEDNIKVASTADSMLETNMKNTFIDGLESNWDDSEGYYQARVGEIIQGKYQVVGTLGKGVFSTVLKCKILNHNHTNNQNFIALKMVRSNDIMRQAAHNEHRILSKLSLHDNNNKKHIIKVLDKFEFRNHIVLAFETMQMDARDMIKKFGGGKSGISLRAIKLFCKQLLIALFHLEQHKIVHADIKPDNILLDEKQTSLKLCDFGSAFSFAREDDTSISNDPTPYLVSRFYRAPEIILGLPYNNSVDIWSLGCCLFEMFTGKVMFPGSTNNDMLRLFMELDGKKINNKIIKRHRSIYIDIFEKEPHFDEKFRFLSRDIDPVTGKPLLRLMENMKTKRDMLSQLLLAKSIKDDKQIVLELKDLLEKMFIIDPTKRISVREALKHPFVKN